MKKVILFAAVSVLAVCAFAGGIENKTNMSTGYIRNPSRNTESSRPEASYYNIAGTGFMADGLYIEAGNQFVWKEYANTWDTDLLSAYGITDGTKSNDETTVLFYPNFDAVYKHGKLAFFGNFGVQAGGGTLDYTEGTTATSALFLGVAQAMGVKAAQAQAAAQSYAAAGNTTAAQTYGATATALSNNVSYLIAAANSHSITVTSITYGGVLGASYQVNDMVALALAGRFAYGTQTMKLKSASFANMGTGDTTVKYDADAMAFSAIFGAHVKPLYGLDVAGQFTTKSSLKYNVNDVTGNTKVAEWCQITTDSSWNVDLAPVVNLGAGYRISDPLYVSTSFNYYFNRWATMASILAESDYDDSFEIAVGADYTFNKYVTASCGTAYGHQGVSDDANNSFNPVLSSYQFAGGFEVHPVEDLTLTTGLTHVHYVDADYYLGDTYKTVLSKNVWMMSLGVTYRFGI